MAREKRDRGSMKRPVKTSSVPVKFHTKWVVWGPKGRRTAQSICKGKESEGKGNVV